MEAIGEALHASEKLDSRCFVELGSGCCVQRHVHNIIVRVLRPLYSLLEGGFLNPLGRPVPGALAFYYIQLPINSEGHD